MSSNITLTLIFNKGKFIMNKSIQQIIKDGNKIVETSLKIQKDYTEKRNREPNKFKKSETIPNCFVLESGELFSHNFHEDKNDSEVLVSTELLYEKVFEFHTQDILQDLVRLTGCGEVAKLPVSLKLTVEKAKSQMLSFTKRLMFGDLHTKLPSQEDVSDDETDVISTLNEKHAYIGFIALYYSLSETLDLDISVGKWIKKENDDLMHRDIWESEIFQSDEL